MAGDDVARMVAEQVAVDCTSGDVDEVLGRQAVARLLPLLRLAGDTGEAAGMVVLGGPPVLGEDRSHDLTICAPDRADGLVGLAFEWRTTGYVTLFQILTGHLAWRTGETGVVLSIEGVYEAGPRVSELPLGPPAARRAAEAAVRALLGQLRAALEHSGPPPSANAPPDLGRSALGVGPAMPPT